MIDNRKTAEEELTANEQFLRLITDNIQDAVRVIDLKTLRYTYANPYATKLFGIDRQFVDFPLGLNLEEKERQRLFLIINDELEHDSEREMNRSRLIELREKNQLTGELIWTENKASFIRDPEGRPVAILSIVRDITERKRTELALRENEERWRKAQAIAHVGNWEIDLRTKKMWGSEEAFRIYGIERVTHELPLAEIQRCVLPHYRPQMDLALGRLIRREGEYDEEFEIHRVDNGEVRFIHSRAELVLAEDGTPVKVEGAIQDITEHKRSEHATLAAEKKFRNLLETIQLVAIILDRNGNISFCNDYFLNLTGWSRDEVLDRNWFDLFIPKELSRRVESVFQSTMGGGGFVSHYENPILTRDGSSRQIVWDNTTLTDPEGRVTGLAGIGVDVTEHRKLEEALRRAEKMEALGQLAGGVAHDLNNVLGILVGYSELLSDKIPEGNPLKKYAVNILASSEKGALIIEDLLTLARRGVSVADVINLNGIVSDFLRTPVFEKLQDYHPRVTFRTELDPELLNIKGSPIHLEKTVINLISNAAEAIAGNGEVVIRTGNRYVDKAIHGYDHVQEGEYVVLTVSDNGSGIAAADIEKIFEPFYTKKVMGRSGTGLGLAVVWGTVKDHNGHVDVQSEDGTGSTFTLFFPVTREKMADDPQKMPNARCMGRGESILIVDDIAAQREMAAMMLASLDYQVHTASSGEEAVAYLQTHTIDVMVLDMIMDPGMDGLETYRRAREINPNQKAVIVSGFSETDRVREAQDLGAGPYVKKPYVLEKIARAIREELSR